MALKDSAEEARKNFKELQKLAIKCPKNSENFSINVLIIKHYRLLNMGLLKTSEWAFNKKL